MAREPKRPPSKAVPADERTVSFEYIKSNLFRVIHADGAMGSVTPSGNLHVAFYSERSAIPKSTTHALNPDHTLGEMLPDKTVSRGTVVREVDVDVILSKDVLTALIEWLQEQVEAVDRVAAAREKIGKKRRVTH